MKILSVRHPWAHLIIHGGKDIENRTWATRYRGLVLIQASTSRTSMGLSTLSDSELATLQFGGVIGVVELVDCVSTHPSEWFEGPFGFVLRNPRALPFVEWGGALGLRDAPFELVQRIGEQHPQERI
jgi:hypothetical protein